VNTQIVPQRWAPNIALGAKMPEELSDEELHHCLREGAKNLCLLATMLEPYYNELRSRFARKPKAEKLLGCRTWNEYCEKVLHRSRRAVNYFLAGGNPVEKRKTAGAPKPVHVQVAIERVESKTVEVEVEVESGGKPVSHPADYDAYLNDTSSLAPTTRAKSSPRKFQEDAALYELAFEIRRVTAKWPEAHSLTRAIAMLRSHADDLEKVQREREA
jgi:hypothetical protein